MEIYGERSQSFAFLKREKGYNFNATPLKIPAITGVHKIYFISLGSRGFPLSTICDWVTWFSFNVDCEDLVD